MAKRTVKAHLFWYQRTTDPTEGFVELQQNAQAFVGRGEPIEFSHENHHYVLVDGQWHAARGQLTGVVYKRASDNLPKRLRDLTVSDLPIDAKDDLAYPMCFALWPERGAALVHFNNQGPRHTVLPAFFGEIGCSGPIDVSPVYKTEMLKRLADKERVQYIEIAFHDPAGGKALRNAGGAVGYITKAADELSALNIRVQVSIGAEQSDGPVVGKAKAIGRWLAKLHAEDPDGNHVKTIKVKGAGSDGQMELLDLLKGREVFEFDVERLRYLDTGDLIRRLNATLHECKPMLREQFGTEP
ncbi:MAG: hypothetical protein ACKVZJ_10375 [Phycisphaerales bacterium]